MVGIVLFIGAMSDLLADVEAFLALSGMTPTVFGRSALGDPGLVPDIRGGRELLPRTEKRLRDFMRDFRPTRDEGAAPQSVAKAS